MKAGVPAGAQTPPTTSLSSVACPTTTSCYAVGYYATGNGAIATLVEHWNGTTWAAQSSPTSTALTTSLRGVACVTDKSCFAVGTAMSAAHNKPFVIRWNGTAWATMTSPGLANAGLDDVACASAKACFSLGSVAASTTSTLLEHWNGAKWTVVTLKNMPTANHLFGITCPSATNCVAVGRRKWTNAGFRTLVYDWNGTTWKAVSPPNRDGSTSNWLNAVSCLSPTKCRAVGTYQANGTYHSLIEFFA
jgi:hypothetical protein